MKERTVSLINSVREMIPIAIKFDLISYHIKINKRLVTVKMLLVI